MEMKQKGVWQGLLADNGLRAGPGLAPGASLASVVLVVGSVRQFRDNLGRTRKSKTRGMGRDGRGGGTTPSEGSWGRRMGRVVGRDEGRCRWLRLQTAEGWREVAMGVKQ